MSWRRKQRRRRARSVAEDDASVLGEAEYIVKCAANRNRRVVTWGPLLFFSTETGDAWVLDPEEGLARSLARDGTPRDPGIYETRKRFGIEWEHEYELVGDVMVLDPGEGSERVIAGYPIQEIRTAISRMGGMV